MPRRESFALELRWYLWNAPLAQANRWLHPLRDGERSRHIPAYDPRLPTGTSINGPMKRQSRARPR